jgi:hypothetical protein
MRIELRDSTGRRLARVGIDEQARPARVQFVPERGGAAQDLFPRWDEAIDDSGALRRCVVCGGDRLYVRRTRPQLLPLVALLAFLGAGVALLGYATNPLVYALLAALLVVDILTLFLVRQQLVCYGCATVYREVRIARDHRPWDRTMADQIAKEPVDLPTALIEHDGRKDGAA